MAIIAQYPEIIIETTDPNDAFSEYGTRKGVANADSELYFDSASPSHMST